ncbi:MAG: TraR/DksA C4-type zinc finger protein [Polyangia bacterium]
MKTHLEPAQLDQLHRQLLNKGAEVNEQLVQLLNGERVSLEGVLAARPGEQPAERLRRFLTLIDAKIQASRRDSLTSYGACERCGAALPFTELQQVPWAERCRACADEP